MRTTVANVSEELNSLTSRHSRSNTEDTLGRAEASIGKNEENNNCSPFSKHFSSSLMFLCQEGVYPWETSPFALKLWQGLLTKGLRGCSLRFEITTGC